MNKFKCKLGYINMDSAIKGDWSCAKQQTKEYECHRVNIIIDAATKRVRHTTSTARIKWLKGDVLSLEVSKNALKYCLCVFVLPLFIERSGQNFCG